VSGLAVWTGLKTRLAPKLRLCCQRTVDLTHLAMPSSCNCDTFYRRYSCALDRVRFDVRIMSVKMMQLHHVIADYDDDDDDCDYYYYFLACWDKPSIGTKTLEDIIRPISLYPR